MNLRHRAAGAEPRGTGLSWFFLRAAPVRMAGAISAVVAFLLMLTLLTLQSFQLSGTQLADQMVGSSDYALQTGTTIPLGDSGEQLDDALRAAVTDAGGTDPIVQYSILDSLTIEDERAPTVGYEEAAWEQSPFPRRLSMTAGRWPADSAEVAVSVTLSQTYPIGSAVKLFDGRWDSLVVGIVEDDYARSGQMLYGREGTWNSLADIDETTAGRYAIATSRFVYWSGGDGASVVSALAERLSTTEDEVPVELLLQQLQSRAELESRGTSPLIEFRLGSLIAPFLAALIGVLLAMRFIKRIRAVLLTIGVPLQDTRGAATISVSMSLLIGLALGSAAGLLSGLAARPLLDLASLRPIGPVHGLASMIAGLVTSSMVGSILAVALISVRRSMSARAQFRAKRIPSHYVLLPVAAILLGVVGWQAALAAQSTDEIILAGICCALAGVALLPLVLEVALAKEPANMSALLAIRRLRADKRQSGWITATVSALVIVAFATTTLLTSAITTMNDSNLATVPPGQAYLEVPSGMPSDQVEALQAEVEEFVGADHRTFFFADGGVDLLVGATAVVDEVTDLEALTGISLSRHQRELLESGGTLRTKLPDPAQVTFEAPDGTTHVLPAAVSEDLSAHYRNLDGFILRSTAEAQGIGLVSETVALLHLTPEQADLAQRAPIELGFNAEWLTLNKTPDVFAEPIEARVAALALSALAVSIMFLFVLSVTRLLRPHLSTLRAVGAGRSWLTTVVVTEAGTVLVVATLASAVFAVMGMFVAITVSGLDLKLIVPWQSIGITLGMLVFGTAVAMATAARRLANDERLGST